MTVLLAHWLLATLTVLVTAHIVPGIQVKSLAAALFAAVIIGVVNAVAFPILVILTLPLTMVTLGLFLFVVNGLCLKLSAALTPGFTIDGFFPAMLGAIVMTVMGWLVRFVFFQGAS